MPLRILTIIKNKMNILFILVISYKMMSIIGFEMSSTDIITITSEVTEVYNNQSLGDICGQQNQCNTSANLICKNGLCECQHNYTDIQINSTLDRNCYPKVAYNESCFDDRQCLALDPNSHCGLTDEMSGRCLCSHYYAFDGSQCVQSWCDWVDYHWTFHRIIVILIVFCIAFTLVFIVISISLHLRSKAWNRRNDSKAFKYPNSLSPKVIVSKYFNNPNESEDEIYLKPKVYIKKW